MNSSVRIGTFHEIRRVLYPEVPMRQQFIKWDITVKNASESALFIKLDASHILQYRYEAAVKKIGLHIYVRCLTCFAIL